MDARTSELDLAGFMKKAFLWTLLPILMLVINAPDATYAQVVTNITPTTTAPLNLGTNVDTVGSTTEITGGTRPGSGTNLFHSFDAFTLGTGDTAHFLNDMQLPTTNIFGRVIGGELATIDGTLRTNNPLNAADPMNFGAANLWLVNPSGLLLGPNARIEVGGSVSMSTANYLRFEGTSTLFDMLSSPASLGLLAVAPVVAFGFVGSNPGDLTVQGSKFSVTEGQSISLVGGNTVIESGTPEGGTAQPVQFSALNGQIQLASAASPGEFDAATLQALPNMDGTSFTSFGSVSLAPGSTINVSGASTVFIKGGQIVLSVNDAVLTTSPIPGPPETVSLGPGSSISTSNSGVEPGADVQISVGNLQMDGATVATINSGDDDGGNISLNATTIGLTNGTNIQSFTGLDFNTGMLVGSGKGGNVTVQGLGGADSHADSFALSNSFILTQTVGPGKGGEVQLNASTLTMDNFSSITTGTSVSDEGQGGGGVGGDVILNVGTGSLLGAASILGQTTNFTPEGGQGGNVIIQGLQGAGSAAESITLSGGSFLKYENFGDSDGGRVAITSKALTMDGAGTTINSSVFQVGRGGEVVVSVQQASLSGGAIITTQSFSAQAGPPLTVQGLQGVGSMADSVVLSGFGSGIISDSTGGTARAGDVALHARSLTVADGAVIQAGTTVTTATAGNVTIDANSVGISGGSRISSQAGDSDAGQITITANTFTLDNSSIATRTLGQGRGGEVVLDAGTVSLSNKATIDSSSTGPGNAGNITIKSGSTVVMQNSSITTEATIASGGQVTVIAPDMVQLISSKISTSVAGSDADTAGGNITIDPQFVILQNSQILAQAFAGTGGNITIISNVFLADPISLVNASSQLGISGQINIQSPVQNVGEQLTPLSQEFSSAAALLAQQCAARAADGKFSTFLVAAREGLPVEPGGFLASPSWTPELLGSRLSGRGPHTQLSAVTGLFPKHDARPIQLAKLGDACRQ